MTNDDIPEEAWSRLKEIRGINEIARNLGVNQTFARYIMEKEGIEPVDPLIVEAEKMADDLFLTKLSRDEFEAAAYSILERGIELGQPTREQLVQALRKAGVWLSSVPIDTIYKHLTGGEA